MSLSPEPAVPVLYIAGAGRSGSTLLDVILDNHPSVAGVGELTNFVRGAYLDGRYCACRRPASICPFWSEVRAEWIRRRHGLNLAAYVLLQDTFDRYAAWPRVALERTWRSRAFTLYASWTVALFQAIRQVSGRQLIVDSSKIPTRAAALALMPGVDLRVLHLVRDGRAVAYSLKRLFRKDVPAGLPRDVFPAATWRTAAFWTLVNVQAGAARRWLVADRSLRLRYEDLMADFPAAARRLSRVIGVDLSDVSHRVVASHELRTGHLIEGNRLRMSATVRLQPDFEWMERLPLHDRRVFWFIAGWLLRAYGYHEDGSRGPDADVSKFAVRVGAEDSSSVNT